ncbi:MAG: ABC transporter ATP-binding protein [Roseiflexus sp.]|nr:ABC transporter ATP-binding protein [Roseiflexus sp.]
MSAGSEIVLEARNITKRFPSVVANENVSLKLYRGEVLALLGENGAGKTTLMNILYGLYHQDSGEVLIRGEPVRISGPSDSIRHGIGMVHQHFMLVPVFTVAENIILGAETGNGPFLDLNVARRQIRELSRQYNLDVDPDAYVKDLSVGQQQRVEIIKALYRKADILILDEPTAVLTPQETEELFTIIRSLTARGASVIFISHKLKEVLAIADRIMVLRRGRVVGETTPREATERSLAEMMVGRSVMMEVEKGEAHPGTPVLTLDRVTVLDDRGQRVVNEVSLEVHAGEILGIAGVQGNGQTELVEAITGLRPVHSGRVLINGRDVTNASPRRISETGCAHVPEDRQEDGLVLTYSVADNLVLNTYYTPPFARGIVRNDRAILNHASRLIERYDVRTPGPLTPVSALSGGNKQKVIIARELSREGRLLIAAQPTRGIDVGSIEFIHQRIVAERDQGAAVLLVSAELDEIMALSDRIAVMYHGKIVATLPAASATREELGLLMAGAQPTNVPHETIADGRATVKAQR